MSNTESIKDKIKKIFSIEDNNTKKQNTSIARSKNIISRKKWLEGTFEDDNSKFDGSSEKIAKFADFCDSYIYEKGYWIEKEDIKISEDNLDILIKEHKIFFNDKFKKGINKLSNQEEVEVIFITNKGLGDEKKILSSFSEYSKNSKEESNILNCKISILVSSGTGQYTFEEEDSQIKRFFIINKKVKNYTKNIGEKDWEFGEKSNNYFIISEYKNENYLNHIFFDEEKGKIRFVYNFTNELEKTTKSKKVNSKMKNLNLEILNKNKNINDFIREGFLPSQNEKGEKFLIISNINSVFPNKSLISNYLDNTIIISTKVFRKIVSLIHEINYKNMGSILLGDIILESEDISDVSDIYIHWKSDFTEIKYRLDEKVVNSNLFFLTNKTANNLKKVLLYKAGEQEFPNQEVSGKIKIEIEDLDFVPEYRISMMPTIFGYKIALRKLEKISQTRTLFDLGFNEDDQLLLKDLMGLPYGMVFVTGPTGSGKTTTLNTLLMNIYSDTNKEIVTVEDPVEYNLPDLSQVQVMQRGEEKFQMTYQKAVKVFLRQKPDVIMIGEIRDEKTLSEAMNAAVSGHLVFSTLHTNNVPSTMTRLLKLGANENIIQDGVRGILSQKIYPKLCNCKIPVTQEDIEKNGLTNDENILKNKNKIFKANVNGCSICYNRNKGYLGKILVYEIAVYNDITTGNFGLPKKYISYSKTASIKLNSGNLSIEHYNEIITYLDTNKIATEENNSDSVIFE